MSPAPVIRALGLLSGEQRPESVAQAQPPDQQAIVLPLGRPERSGDRFRRATRDCLLALAAVDAMLEDGQVSREAIAGDRTALLYVTAAAYGASNREFIEGRAGAMHFAYTAPAVVPAEVAIEFGMTGPYAIFIGGPPAALRAIWQAALWLESGACDQAVVLAVETFAECADLYRRSARLLRWPLVEAAACLWLEPGQGELALESIRGRRGRGAPPADGPGEAFACAPLAELDRRWRRREATPLELEGAWRGEQVRLRWSGAISQTRGSAA